MFDIQLRVTLTQYDIVWGDKLANIDQIQNIVAQVSNTTDIVILPEMCTTGFTLNIEELAETCDGNTISTFGRIAKEYNVALCGSFLCRENDKFYNRSFFITPEDKKYYYDKRHLFKMGLEDELYTAGKSKTIISYKGFNVCLFVCYDLRFPVWTRNVDNQYDLLIYVANWPESRKEVWTTLLKARAIENMSYVCVVNRVGADDNDLTYSGLSMAVNPRGQVISVLPEYRVTMETVTLEKNILIKDRKNFPIWKDADKFTLDI